MHFQFDSRLPISIVYIVLGHEILFPSHKLSRSSALRCDLLNTLASHLDPREFAVLFMGQGRLQGDCKKTISQCMLEYYQSIYGSVENLYIDRSSKDTVGDAVYSQEVISHFSHFPDLAIITSDWHVGRADHIFRRVFDRYPKSLNFYSTDEMTTLPADDINMIYNSELRSLKAFCKTFSGASSNSTWKDLLLSRHPLYMPK